MTAPRDDAEPVRDLRLAPIAVAAWAGSWLATDGGLAMLIIGSALLAGLLVIMIARRSWLVAATAIVLAATYLIGLAHLVALERTAVSRLADSAAVATVEVTLTRDPRIQPAEGRLSEYLITEGVVWQVSGRGQSWRERSPVLLTAGGDLVEEWAELTPGTRVRTTVRLAPRQPGSELAAVARVHGRPTVIADSRWDLAMVEHVRAGLRAAVASGTPEQRALVPSLVLGDTQHITAKIKEEFLLTGLTHLTAVSGANLAIMLAFLLVLARWMGVRGWWLRLVGLGGVIIFVALCRTEPSVLRAAAMGLVALAALGTSGRAKGLRSLFVAMILLLIIDPWLGRSIGFALSVLASGGIVWWARRWAVELRRWLPMIMAESITVPLAAHLVTLPVTAAISGQVSMIGVLTNAVAGPFVGPATVLGFAAAGVSVINATVAGWLGRLACWAAQPILWTGHYGSVLPGSSWSWPTGSVSLAVLAAGCLALGVALPWILHRAWPAAVLALVMIIAVVRAPAQPGWPPPDWSVVACDVGQGDGLVVRTGDRQGIVVDTGPEPGPIGRCLDQLRIRVIPLIILTHYHADHVGGLAGVLPGRRVQQIWVSPLRSPADAVARITGIATAEAIPVRTPPVGSSVPIGVSEVTVLGPLGRLPAGTVDDGEESAAENDLSLTTMITVDGIRILMTGDIEPDQQQRILDSGADLGADVLKVPHHGSARQDADFLAATHARVAIASAGQDNGYGHPAPRTVALLRSQPMTVLCTCRRGSIAISADGGRLGVVTQRAG